LARASRIFFLLAANLRATFYPDAAPVHRKGADPLSSNGIGSAMASGFYAAQAIADTLAGRRRQGAWYCLEVMAGAAPL
jgi:hypothetical protein